MQLTSRLFAGALLALFACAAPANAQLLTFVSATGGDGRPCTVEAQPCRTLQRAINVTAAGGEIRLLSSLPNQTATIGQSLTLAGGGKTMFGAIVVNAVSAVVTIRDLHLNGSGIQNNGLTILNAAAVHIQGSSFERYAQDGIRSITTAAELFVVDVVSRDNGNDGLETRGLTTVDNSRFENNEFGLFVDDGGKATITRSLAARNTQVGFQTAGIANFSATTAIGNGVGFFTNDHIVLESCSAHRNAGQGLWVQGGEARVSNSVFTANGIGIDNDIASTLTLRNNLVTGNTAQLAGNPLTTEAAQ